MDFKAHALYLLNRSRGFTEELLKNFQSEDDWFYQVDPQVNHPTWIVGHLGLVDNMVISKFRPELQNVSDQWKTCFGRGSVLSTDRSSYPASEDLLNYLRERRELLLKVVEELTDDELSAPAPAATEPSPIAGAPSMGQLLIFICFHEGIHGGQLSTASRSLGHPPVVG